MVFAQFFVRVEEETKLFRVSGLVQCLSGCDGRRALGGWYVVVQRCASVRGVQLPRRRGDATSNVAVVIERQQWRDVTVGAVTAVLVGGGGAVEQSRHGDAGRSVGVPRGDGANEGPV